MHKPPYHSSECVLVGFGLCLVIMSPYSSCGIMPSSKRRVQTVYHEQTGRLEQLIHDANNNGKPDAWSYIDGTKGIRVELDQDEDGVIDRWEYYDPHRQLQKIGVSSEHDGKVDTWAFRAPDGGPERIERSTRRDGTIDRTEFYEKGVIVRAEQDVDHDGRTDTWETYQGGTLASVALDTKRQGSPDRRFLYRRDGSFIEDPATSVSRQGR